MSSTNAVRIAISHFIMFTLMTYTFMVLGFTVTEDQDPNFRFARRGFRFISGCFGCLILASLLLLYGVLKENIAIVKTWLISSILVSVVLMFLLLSATIYIGIGLPVYWSVLVYAIPFVLAFWMADGITVVFSYYKKVVKFDEIRKNLV